MIYRKKTIRDIDVYNKKVLVRCDYNVPLNPDQSIADDKRIAESVPTIRYLLDHHAAVILCTHLGRPKGQWNLDFSTQVLVERVSRLLGTGVKFASDVIGEDAMQKAADLAPGEVLLLENVRFHAEEEANDKAFASKLASMAELFVSDAFGTCHRAHASTAGIAEFLPSAVGFLIEKELNIMGGALEAAKKPFVVILGGAKVSDKIGVINNLIDKADYILTGGGMPFTFIKALGGEIGKSMCENDRLDYAKDIMRKAQDKGVNFLLPVDVVAADRFEADATAEVFDSCHIPAHMIGMSIGPKTVAAYNDIISRASTIIWNGPLGVYEFPAFAESTREIAAAVAAATIVNGAVSIVGGGDSAAVIADMGLEDRITHVSTGGGAALEFLEGKELPGISCITDKDAATTNARTHA
jgi:phosphoglycerate kinase